MRQIPLGAKGSFSLLVQPEHLANRFKDAILPPVFATPVMIMVMENAALNAIRAALSSLGFGHQEELHYGQRLSGYRNVNPAPISLHGCLT
jgi:hypothetical protein